MSTSTRVNCNTLLLCVLATSVAAAEPGRVGRVLEVGPGAEFLEPSQAANVVRTGDVVRIAAGTYRDCAIWPKDADRLTIEAKGGPVVITGLSCEFKALFVVKGNDITIRGITFEGAKAPHHNGAGIRAEGRDLTVESSQFIENEEGILAAPSPGSAIVVRNSTFKGNGNCIEACAHGIYVGSIAELRIEDSHFFEQHIGHHVKSRAARTVLIGNTIEDGPRGTASYLVDIPNGGALVMRRNTLEKGPLSDNPEAAVTLGEEGVTNPTPEITIEDNEFTNDMTAETLFVRNATASVAALQGNRINGAVNSLQGRGAVDGRGLSDRTSTGGPR
jgi:hypothetical protein